MVSSALAMGKKSEPTGLPFSPHSSWPTKSPEGSGGPSCPPIINTGTHRNTGNHRHGSGGLEILNLTADRMEQAISLAADGASGLRYCIDFGDFSKSLHPGFHAWKGIVSALVIAGGRWDPRGCWSTNPVSAKLIPTSPT